eukprot:2384044-Pleurochrysis_carterae.AAC.1
MREHAKGEEEWKLLRKRTRQGIKVTILEKCMAAGLAQQETCKATLKEKRAKLVARASERARIEALPLAEHYSDLKLMGVDREWRTCRTSSRSTSSWARLALRSSCRTARRTCYSCRCGSSRPTRTRTTLTTATRGLRVEAFEVEAVVGKVVADGQTAYVNHGRVAAGIVLYHIVWQGYPLDMMWYEPGENLGSELLSENEQRLAAHVSADEASARKDAELIDLEESERMPAS